MIQSTMFATRKFAYIQVLLFVGILSAQVEVAVNSGNPALPFPQFMPYITPTDTFYNLATHNGVGVSHAEMEKTIREAYQIMMNRASKPGGDVNGIEYVMFKSTPSCSEGDGYALLAAAALADKKTFDGLWLWIHDNRMNKVTTYGECIERDPDYNFSRLPGWTGVGANSAADGDFDIALALLYAYRQWGEFMGIDDACGNPISYKYEAIEFIRALTDTLTYEASGNLFSGDIGLDGYFKSGDSWAELSGWSKNNKLNGFTKSADQPGPQQQYFDYIAPAYFRQFADFLAGEDSVTYAWNISQFRRAEASSDWLMGKLYTSNEKTIPMAGKVSMIGDSGVEIASTGNMGEDFRLGWRTILNCVWHGDPHFSWDSRTHRILPDVANGFERETGIRFARFLWDARQTPWNNECVNSSGGNPHEYWGPVTVLSDVGITGETGGEGFYYINWLHGTGSPSAVVSRNYDLMAEMYRQCEIEYDVNEIGDKYLTSVPFYFHGWFRLLGMLVLSGNYASPSKVKPSANMKVYCDVDKTFARKDEKITYTISYRNYGSLDADGVIISDTLPAGLSYVSSTENGEYNKTSHTVTWRIGSVAGCTSRTGSAPTDGAVKVTVIVDNDTKRQSRNRVAVSCASGSGWQANEYPNTVSSVMKRNYVDILDKPLLTEEGVHNLPVLHGGRPGVHFSVSMDADAENIIKTLRFRLFNDADEAYIDFSNYRFSYFMHDSVINCLTGTDSCPEGWQLLRSITQGVERESVLFRHERLVPGSNAGGAWNQRLIIQPGNPEDSGNDHQVTTIDWQLSAYQGIAGRIHKGGMEPLHLVVEMHSIGFKPIRWDDDWSWNSDITDNDGGFYYPITPDFTDPALDNPGVPVDRLHPKYCENSTVTVDNILVEEWDGYVWRRVFGTVPQLTVAAEKVKPLVHKLPELSIREKKRIYYSIPKDGRVTLQLIDIKGRIVTTPVNKYQKAGTYTVPILNAIGSNIYIVRLKSNDGSLRKKIALYK